MVEKKPTSLVPFGPGEELSLKRFCDEQDPRLNGVDMNAPSGVYDLLSDESSAVPLVSEREIVERLGIALCHKDISLESLVENGRFPAYLYLMFKDEFDLLMKRISALKISLSSIPESNLLLRAGMIKTIQEHIAVFWLKNHRKINIAELFGSGENIAAIVREAKVKATALVADPMETLTVLRSLDESTERARNERVVLYASISKHLISHLEELGYVGLNHEENNIVAVVVEDQPANLIDKESPWKDPLERNVNRFFAPLSQESPYRFNVEVTLEVTYLTQGLRRDSEAAARQIDKITDRCHHEERILIVFKLEKK